MSLLGVIAATGVSLAAIAALAATDPKRRRAFRLPPLAAPPSPRLLWTLALAPGVLAALAGGGGGFVLWFGAATVAGWGLAALSPDRTERLAQAVARAQSRLSWRRRAPAPPKASALEHRVTALEAELTALRAQLRTAEDAATRRKPDIEPQALRPGRVA